LLALAFVTSLARAKDHAAVTEGLDCSACHTSEDWKMAGGGAGFDHARTGFPLVGGHRAAACSGCHDGRKELPTLCAGCHPAARPGRRGAAAGADRGARRGKAGAVPGPPRPPPLPLTGAHAVIECTGCHAMVPERTWSTVPWDCYACHSRDYHRQDIHPIHDA